MNLPIQAQPVSRQRTAIATETDGVNPSVCVGGSIQGNRVCVNIPVLGRRCFTLPIPRVPAGASVSACTCNTWGIPTGAKISVSAMGRKIWGTSIGFGC